MDDGDDWPERFLCTPAIRNPGERAALYRAAARGRFVRVVRGVYVAADYWAGLGFEQRHLARMRAIHLLRPGTVFSHLSAAIVWGIPVVGGDVDAPDDAHETAPGRGSIQGRPLAGVADGGGAEEPLGPVVAVVHAPRIPARPPGQLHRRTGMRMTPSRPSGGGRLRRPESLARPGLRPPVQLTQAEARCDPQRPAGQDRAGGPT